jgi:hypothetical protein
MSQVYWQPSIISLTSTLTGYRYHLVLYAMMPMSLLGLWTVIVKMKWAWQDCWWTTSLAQNSITQMNSISPEALPIVYSSIWTQKVVGQVICLSVNMCGRLGSQSIAWLGWVRHPSSFISSHFWKTSASLLYSMLILAHICLQLLLNLNSFTFWGSTQKSF